LGGPLPGQVAGQGTVIPNLPDEQQADSGQVSPQTQFLSNKTINYDASSLL